MEMSEVLDAATTGRRRVRELQEEDRELLHAARCGHLLEVQRVVGKCADVNVKDGAGYTALMWAASHGHLEVVRYLAGECGADVNDIDWAEYTALTWATIRGHIEVVRYLVGEHDADVNVKNQSGDTAVMWAASHGHLEVVRYLVGERKAGVNIKNQSGDTALMWAASHGHLEVVRYLVGECGADVNIKNKAGETAIRVASDRGHQAVQRFLTLFVSPAQTNGASAQTPPDSPAISWSIPPIEVELIRLCTDEQIGGEYAAKWLDADTAVKLFIPDSSHCAFQGEIRLWQRLRHPNILKMYGACSAGSQLQFFVCEYASRGSLLECIQSLQGKQSQGKQPAIGPATRWNWLYEAALGLEYLHERGIVHGDLRCGNILVGSDGLAKLSNFRLSGAIGGAGRRGVGSERWLAPGLLEGGKPSSASDVYSLGMCILEAVTGEMPWNGEPIWKLSSLKGKWKPEKGSSRCEPFCPAGVARDLVWRMCSRDPTRRLQLSLVVHELEQLAAKEHAREFRQELQCTFGEYDGGRLVELWHDVQDRMNDNDNPQYSRAFDELATVHERLQHSIHHPTLLTRFSSLLSEFSQTIEMTAEHARIAQLSASRATSTSLRAFQWRINSILAALGESSNDTQERNARWEEQRSEQIELFVSGVSDTYVLLQDLESAEERSAFLRLLKAEMENTTSQYTARQLAVLKRAYDDIASCVGSDDALQLAPEWFIPWYELTDGGWECLGAGGFGSVYRAKWLDSDVVVKQLDVGGSTTSSSYHSVSAFASSAGPASDCSSQKAEKMATFRREVDIWFGFNHPHVVRLFGACHVGRPFFVCEFATNGTLVEYLRENPDELWLKLHEAALGVQYLHARRVVHGDLKGNNIVVGSDRKAKVTDFGLSASVTSASKPEVSGALNWVAPECIDRDGTKPTFASDVYSLGMCIVEACRVVDAVRSGGDTLGCLPWRNLPEIAVKYHVKRGKLPPQPKSCGDNEWELVKRVCAFDPDKRMKISTVVDELGKLARGKESDAGSIPTKPAVTMELVPGIISSSREELRKVQHRDAEEVALYASLWDDLEQKYAQIEGNQREACHAAFSALVGDAKESTLGLLVRQESVVAMANTTMRCYTLRRRLQKFCDAYAD